MTSRFSLRVEASTEGARDATGAVVVVAAGELDYAVWPQFRRCLLGLVDAGARAIVLELSLVSFIDSAAIGVLVSAARRLSDSGNGRLVVACASENERILRIFDIAGVASLIPLYHSRPEALAAVEEAQLGTLPGLPRRQSTPLAGGEERAPGSAMGAGAVRRYAAQAASGAESSAGEGEGEGADLAHGLDELA